MLCLVFLLSMAHSANDAPSFGGNVTPLNLNMTSTSSKWVVFFGNSSSALGSSSLSVPNPDNESGRLVSLIDTNSYYWISDGSSISFSNLSSADLNALDAKYSLGGAEASSNLFNETKNFTLLQPYGPGGAYWITGPSVFYPGFVGANHSDSAYSQGVFQSGSNIVFLVPLSSATLENGTGYQYVFALPYDSNGSNQVFYLFSTLTNAPPSGGGSYQQVPFRWSYDENGLLILTVPRALITIKNSKFSSISDNADSSGRALFRLFPGTYWVTVSASGYNRAEAEITLHAISRRLNLSVQPEANLTYTSKAGTQTVCFNGECFTRTGGDLVNISEISCTGGICKFVGDDFTEFIAKYRFKKEPTLKVSQPQTPRESPYLGIQEFFARLGRQLSGSIGGLEFGGGQYIGAFVVVILALLAAAFMLNPLSMQKPKAGHD